MNTVIHSLSIGIEQVDNDLFLTWKAIGPLTYADYEVIAPMIDLTLAL